MLDGIWSRMAIWLVIQAFHGWPYIASGSQSIASTRIVAGKWCRTGRGSCCWVPDLPETFQVPPAYGFHVLGRCGWDAEFIYGDGTWVFFQAFGVAFGADFEGVGGSGKCDEGDGGELHG